MPGVPVPVCGSALAATTAATAAARERVVSVRCAVSCPRAERGAAVVVEERFRIPAKQKNPPKKRVLKVVDFHSVQKANGKQTETKRKPKRKS